MPYSNLTQGKEEHVRSNKDASDGRDQERFAERDLPDLIAGS